MMAKDKLFDSFKIALAQAVKDPRALPDLLVRSGKVLGIIKRGEKRRVENERRYGMTLPYACVFSVTWRCNLECKGCYAANYQAKEELSVDQIEKTILECIDLGVYLFVIAGGEPLMVEGLLERLSRIKDAFFIFYTNGTKLEREQVKILKDAKHILPVISIEGEEGMTDLRRGEGVGHKVGEAIKALESERVIFGFSAMVTHKNLRHVLSRDWLDRLWDMGARYGFFIDYIPMKSNLEESFILTDEDRDFKESAIAERNREAKPPLFNLPPDEYGDGECKSAGKGIFHINADGNVEPCPFCHWAADNIREKSVKEILDSEFFRHLRDLSSSLENPRKECLLFANEDKVAKIADVTGAFRTEKSWDLEKIGDAIARTTEQGANQLGNISFTIDDEYALKNQAREEAIKKTKEKADMIAKQTGMKLDKIKRVL